MTGITHPFVSGVSEGADPTLVGPNEWNAGHAVDSIAPSGLTGSVAASRYVGGTVSGPKSGYLAMLHGTETVTRGGGGPTVVVNIGTVNYGSPLVGSALLANTKGYVVGRESTGIESFWWM